MTSSQNPAIQGNPAKLFLISFSALFLEMAAIRWLNASSSVLSYFNNLILISCFFGLGTGCLLAGRRRLMPAFALVFLLFVCAVMFLKHIGIDITYKGDVMFASEMDNQASIVNIQLSVLLGFLANVVFFIILGQELGNQIEAVQNPLRAYSYDIAGSLVGTLTYAAFAWAGTPPHVWFLFGCLILLLFLPRKAWLVAVSLVLVAASAFLVSQTYQGAKWSPYYKVEVFPYHDKKNVNHGHMIVVDNLRIQDALDLSPKLAETDLSIWVPYYQVPYRVKKNPQSVLILGAGSGNEAVFARAFGADRVVAVEIDPSIAGLGRTLHPQRPYLDPQVKVKVNDARAVVSSIRERFDLVVMSALDSHKNIPGMSSLRLESFIYTREAFAQIKTLLNPGGVFCLSLSSTRPWMGERVFWSLNDAFGFPPLMLKSEQTPWDSVAFIMGEKGSLPTAGELEKAGISVLPPPASREGVRLSTDNWPFLYLEKNRIPPVNLVVLVILLVLCFAILFYVEPGTRRPSLHYFFLGAGFMLLETRSITQLALLFGLTWHVTALVISSILLFIYLTNRLVMTGHGLPTRYAYPLLFLTLAGGYLFPFHALSGLAFLPRLACSALAVGLPIFWAAFIFSNSFKMETRVNRAFGSNLLGVVLGGALEYASNLWGLNTLYLLALGLYFLSMVTLPGKRGSIAMKGA